MSLPYRSIFKAGMQMQQPVSRTQGFQIEHLQQELLQALAEQKLLEQRLYTSEAQMRAVLEAMTDIVLILDSTGERMEVMPTQAALSDEFDRDAIGLTIAQFLSLSNADRAETFFSQIRRALETRQTVIFEYSLTLEHKRMGDLSATDIDTSEEMWFTASISPISESSVVWVARNITDRKHLEQALHREKDLAQITLQSIGDAVMTTDAFGCVKDCNPIAEKLTGWTVDEARGKPLSDIFRIVNDTTRKPVENPVEVALREGRIVTLMKETILISREGTEYAIDDSAAPIRDRDGQIVGAVLVFHDITKSHQIACQLSWQASHDTLTGLVNRREFERVLNSTITTAKSDNSQHVLCYLDLDRFKVVNDTCGHGAGDRLLCQLTALMQNHIREIDTLARLGGDEFALLLYRCSLADAEPIADRLRQIIRDFRFFWENKTFAIGVSIGLVTINDQSADLTSVLSAADTACYAAKQKGRNCIFVYREDDLELTQKQDDRQWSLRIQSALEENRFCLYSQRIISLKPGNRREHYEILLRLVDENGQLILPGAFLQAAERYDLIGEIDQWVIRKFLTDYQQSEIATIAASRSDDILYAINLSGVSISNPQFLTFLQQQLAQFNIVPQTLCFEITETAAISNLAQATQFISSLKQLGCRFALDDFGVGMSSLAYLKHLPIDYLKIDGSFIKNLVRDPVDQTMVECCHRIAHVMNIETIAEFVEDRSTLEQLQKLGIDCAQGYGIAKPIPFLG